MKRIILHWTGGVYQPNKKDLRHYHFLIDGDGRVHKGQFPVEANLVLKPREYAAHTRKCNTEAIGVGLCGMNGGESPSYPGDNPIKHVQWESATKLCARLGVEYDIPVSKSTMLSHAEVEDNLGIPQPGKWDISYLPWIRSNDPHVIGNIFRVLVRDETERLMPKPPLWERFRKWFF